MNKLYQLYLEVFFQRQCVIENSNALINIKQYYKNLKPLSFEHFEAEVVFNTPLGIKIIEIIT